MYVDFDIREIGSEYSAGGYGDLMENGYSMVSTRWEATGELPDELTIEATSLDFPEWSDSFTIALADMKLEEAQQ